MVDPQQKVAGCHETLLVSIPIRFVLQTEDGREKSDLTWHLSETVCHNVSLSYMVNALLVRNQRDVPSFSATWTERLQCEVSDRTVGGGKLYSKVTENKVSAVKLFTVLKLWGQIITLASWLANWTEELITQFKIDKLHCSTLSVFTTCSLIRRGFHKKVIIPDESGGTHNPKITNRMK